MDYKEFLDFNSHGVKGRNITKELTDIMIPLGVEQVTSYSYKGMKVRTVRNTIDKLNRAYRGQYHWAHKVDKENKLVYIARDE